MAWAWQALDGVEPFPVDDYPPDQGIPISDYDLMKTDAHPVLGDLDQRMSQLVRGPDYSDPPAIKEEPDQLPDVLEVTQSMASERPSCEPDSMGLSQQELDARGGAAQDLTTPGPPIQHNKPEKDTATQMQEVTVAKSLENPSHETLITEETTQESPKSVTMADQNIDLGSSLFGPRASTAIGGRQTREERAITKAQQLEMSKRLGDIFKSTRERQASPTAEITQSQRDNDAEDPDLETRYFKAKRQYDEKCKAGPPTPTEEFQFLRLEHRYNLRMRALEEDQDEEHSIFVSPARQKRKSNAKDGTKNNNNSETKSKRPRRKGPVRLNAHNNVHQSNLFDDAKAAEGMQDMPTFAAGTNRQRAWQQIRAKVPEDSLKKFNADRKRVESAIRNFAGGEVVKPHDAGHWSLKGLNTPLKHHQVIQAGWMRGREAHGDPQGGIVADQMGLGKTMSALALIVNSRPKSSDGPCTTLVVLPTALINQWQSEVGRHCVKEMDRKKWGLGRVRPFRDSQSENFDLVDFENSDVIITSYHDVMRSWPVCEYPEGLTEEEKQAYFYKNFHEKRGPLHRMRWLRVIIDEGHKIRNSESRTAQGCFNLVADHHFVLTGTPMVNGAHDLYSLFTFIKHPQILDMTLDSFKRRFCNKKDSMSFEALSVELLNCMQRFTHADNLVTGRLVSLPKVTSLSPRLTFSKLERVIYEVCRERFKQRAQTMAAQNGSAQTKMINVLALITLLRQLTAYPLLIPARACIYLEDEDFARINEAVTEAQARSRSSDHRLIHTMRQLLRYRQTCAEVQTATDNLESVDVHQSDVAKPRSAVAGTGKGHGKPDEADYSKFMQSVKRSANATCGKCGRVPNHAVGADCGHMYCDVHLEDLLHEAAHRDQARATCVVRGCGVEINKPSDERGDGDVPRWLAASGEILPSTKTLAVKAQILEWLDPSKGGHPSNKVVIFTQWRAMVDVLARVCESEGWGHTTLHGGLKTSARNKNIGLFNSEPSVKVLVCTLLTGGVGLNLQAAASCVLNVDPYWNLAGEQQAFGRVYRIGQTKPTAFTNLTVKNTIDDKLRQIKLRKKVEIESVIKGHSSRNLHTLMSLLESDDDDDDDDDDDQSSEDQPMGESQDGQDAEE